MTKPAKFITDAFTFADLPNDRFRMALSYWQTLRGSHELPPASAIDPTKIPRVLLRHIAIADVEDGSKNFRVRLVGDGIVQGSGENKTGKFLDDFPGTEQVLERLRFCVQRRKPHYAEGPVTWAPNDFRTSKALGLPFAGADNTVRRIITYMEFF